MKRIEVSLKDNERRELEAIRSKGHHTAREITHANILLLSDEGGSHKEIASDQSQLKLPVNDN